MKNNMKNKNIFVIGTIACLLLVGLGITVVQLAMANPAIPNPGHGTSELEGDGDLNMNSNKITNLATPIASTDASTMAYVDAQAGGGGYSECYGASVAGTVSCDAGYDKVISCQGSCTTQYWSLQGLGIYKAYVTPTAGVSCGGGSGYYQYRYCCVDVLSGGEWFAHTAGQICYTGEEWLQRETALCCK